MCPFHSHFLKRCLSLFKKGYLMMKKRFSQKKSFSTFLNPRMKKEKKCFSSNLTHVYVCSVLNRQNFLSARRYPRGRVHYSFLFLHATIDLSITHMHNGHFSRIVSKNVSDFSAQELHEI